MAWGPQREISKPARLAQASPAPPAPDEPAPSSLPAPEGNHHPTSSASSASSDSSSASSSVVPPLDQQDVWHLRCAVAPKEHAPTWRT